MKYLIVVALLCAACDSATGVDLTPSVQTELPAYALETHSYDMTTSIRFSYRNPTADTIYIAQCNGELAAGLFKQQGVDWVPALGRVVPECLGQHVIPPGATYYGKLNFVAVNPWVANSEPKFMVNNPNGEYQLELFRVSRRRFPNATDADILPRALRVSNRFTLKQLDINETDCARHYAYERVASWAREKPFSVPGMTSSWFDPQHVCLGFGIESNAVIPVLEAKLKELGIPRDGVRMYVEPAGGDFLHAPRQTPDAKRQTPDAKRRTLSFHQQKPRL
ncbi:MAG TPA: hypothetical protein VM100_05325 [Longimicrobiales bacterium]|nr:hypothetical protein [Longimicrobiales bacterium]